MKGNPNFHCAWRFCCCGECVGKPRALRIRQDGIEWEPRAWAEVYG